MIPWNKIGAHACGRATRTHCARSSGSAPAMSAPSSAISPAAPCRPEDLEELSADVFLRLWRSRAKLKDGADLSPYLAAIARNCMKNYFRTQGKQPPVRQSYEDLLLSDKSDLCRRCRDHRGNRLPHPGAGQAGRSRDRSLVIRFYFYGEKTSALTKACGLTDTAVRLRLHRRQRKTPEIYDRKGF